MDHKENLLGVLSTIFRWKKPILYICAAAAVGSVIISLLLPNYYESTTLFYAASPDLAKPPAVGDEIKEKDYYGEEEDIDRVLSIAQSSKIADYLIGKFNLYEHYEIDTSHIKAPYRVRKKFFKLYNVTKTKYDGIEIAVEDKDPQIAAEMCNAARNKVNQIGQELLKSIQLQQMNNYNQNIESKQKELKILGDTLRKERFKYGIYNTLTQSEKLTELIAVSEARLARTNARKNVVAQYVNNGRKYRDSLMMMSAAISGLEQELIGLRDKLKLFNEGMSAVELLEEIQEEAYAQLSLDKERLKQLQSTYQADFTAIHVVETGEVPIVKSRPVRSLIVLGSVFIAFFFSIIGVLIFDMYKDIDWRKIYNGE